MKDQVIKCRTHNISDNRSAEVTLPNRLGYERIAMEGAAAFAKLTGFLPEKIEDLKTITAEACTNAIQHGNKGQPDAKVTVILHFNGETLSISVVDEGDGISELTRDPDIDRIIEELDPPSGFGLFLIKRLCDQVDFNDTTTAGEGHAVKMVINMPN